MNVFGKLKAVFVGVDEEEYDEIDGYETDDLDQDEDDFEQPEVRSSSRRDRGVADDKKVVNINATARLKVVLIRPDSYAKDANPVADHLKCKRAVVINFERTGNGEARRLLDFLSGVAYAQDGSVQRIAERAFLITPYSVDVESSDFLYEFENGISG